MVKSNVKKKIVFSLLLKGSWRVVPAAPRDLGSWSYSLPFAVAVPAARSVSLFSLAAEGRFALGRTNPSWPSFKGPSGDDSLCLHLASVSPLSILGGRETAELRYRMRGRQMGREFSSDCTAHLFGIKMTDT